MLRTNLCHLLGIEAPVIQAAIAPFTSPELIAAVSNAGGLGSLGTAMRPVEAIQEDLERTHELTDRPFAVNFKLTTLNEEAWTLTLDARPAIISLALAWIIHQGRAMTTCCHPTLRPLSSGWRSTGCRTSS